MFGMQITIKDIESHKVALCHLMMENTPQTIEAIINTDEWKLPEDSDDKVVNVSVQFNGVEADPHVLEKLMTEWYNSIQTKFEKKYEDVEAEIARRVEMEVNYIAKNNIEPYAYRLRQAVDQIENLPFINTPNDWMSYEP